MIPMARRDHSRRDGGPSQRRLRVGEELRHALARVLERGELRDPALRDAPVTVTEVRVSPDLKNATAYVMPLGGRNIDETLAALRRGSGYLRGVLAREVELRHAPTIGFALDTSFEQASRIDALLHRPEVARDLEAPGSDLDDGSDPDDGA
jgi:ribosome-binding factor A